MKGKIISLGMFAVGAVIGSAVTYFYVKKKYDKIIEEEVNSERDRYRQSLKEKQEDLDILQQNVNELGSIVHNEKVNDYEYGEILEADGTITNPMDDDIFEEEVDSDILEPAPYVIPPEEFDEKGYDLQTFLYYSNGMLTDDMDIPVIDIENTVGLDATNHFGEYEADSVFIRNDRLKIDYEILYDRRNYDEVQARRTEVLNLYQSNE